MIKTIGSLACNFYIEGGYILYTKPHTNPENGYAIRISKNLPKNAANLSYVHVDKPTPSKNINLKDYSENIQENKIQEIDEIIDAHIDSDGYIEINQEVYRSETPNILLTNEYANNLERTPLFYKYKASELFDTNNIQVMIQMINGELSAPKFLHDYKESEYNEFIYTGDKINITRINEGELSQEDVFKYVLERSGAGYHLVVYSAKELTNNGYQLNYSGIVDGKTKPITEVMNLEKVFNRSSKASESDQNKTYQIISNEDNSFSIKLNNRANNFLIDETNREPYVFDYQLKSKVKTRLGDKNPLTANIAVIYLNDTVFNGINVMPALRKIVDGNTFMPDYLFFDNPHPRREGINSRQDSQYWEASINMPLEHWLDYDIVIISGHGEYDISQANQAIREYLKLGGILFIETAGELENALILKNNQITEVAYSLTQTEQGAHEFVSDTLADRYFDISDIYEANSISPVIEYRGRESESDWDALIRHENGGQALIRKEVEGAGQVLYSNLGLLESVLFNNTTAYQLFTNLLLVLLEERIFVTPVFKDFLYHKNDLYEEEYTDKLGQTIYIDDRSDEDESQIVAKKIINKDINNYVREYLPQAYRNWEKIDTKINLFDSETMLLVNNRFRLSGEFNLFEETTQDAIPGFRYISYSGSNGAGRHNPSLGEINVETTETQSFFEQELGRLPAGQYQVTVRSKTNNSEAGGFAVYDITGEVVAEKTLLGTSDWAYHHVYFTLTEPKRLYIRLGNYATAGNANISFNEVSLQNNGSVRMMADEIGPLYAYAISPKGKTNQLVAYEQTYSNPEIIKENVELQTTLKVRSFTYRWHTEENRHQKQYGSERTINVSMHTKDKDIVLGNILEFIPALQSGVEWARKQNVYYEFEIENDRFLNLSIYDPMRDKFFYEGDGNWILNHNEIWQIGIEPTIQVRLHTNFYRLIATNNFYRLIATNNRYSLGFEDNQEIKTLLPSTEDEKKSWYLRIQNGQFSKDSINASELEELQDLNTESHYDDYLIGEHLYAIPEYERQAFYPTHGQRLINNEKAVYVNPNKIEVQGTPIVLKEIDVEKELLEPNSDRTLWVSDNILWDTKKLPSIYLDQNNTGDLVLLTQGFRIDYEEGSVLLDSPTNGVLYASYSHDNFRIFKRNFENKHISSELLTTRDGYNFEFKERNILTTFAPRLYQGRQDEDNFIHPSRYRIDYQNGRVEFFNPISERVYAMYDFFTEKELTYSDVNKNTGEIYLEERISFKDDIYVTYLIEENTLEYKGYYDEALDEFIELNLNPTTGHQFTYMREGAVENLQGIELLDKEIFIYLLPYRSVYYKKTVTNAHAVRHVFHKEEWERIKESQPAAILLAQIQVQENTKKEDIIIMDARKRGGGLKESIKEEDIRERTNQTSAFWDIGSFDGMAYYKNGVLIVRLPEKVLISNGGQFTEDEIKKTLSKYMAYGVHPIIEYIKENDE